jgi:hypothetical protein
VNDTRAIAGERRLDAQARISIAKATVLAVGDTQAWDVHGHGVPSDHHVVYVDFHDVGQDLMQRVSPRLVVSPILARNFDCVDLAELLGRLRFAGRYRAFGPQLPNPTMITREVRSLVPALDFDVMPLV